MFDCLDKLDRLEARIDRALAKPLGPAASIPSKRLTELSLGDFIPAVSKRFARPNHLAHLLDVLERARREPIRAVVSVPPRHGKTETLLHYIAWQLLRDPSTQIAYISYAHRFAEKKSRKARELARAAGVPLASDAQARSDWRTGVDDGGLWATSLGGAVTGEGFHVMIVDDPVKDRAKAESLNERENAWEWFTDTAYTRLEPTGSCIVNMARWHEDDLAGRLIKDGWIDLTTPAVSDEGKALWPERWPLERLQDIRATLGEYGWASLYQGRPRPRGLGVFRDVQYYDELPKTYRVGIGIDCAVTAKTSADYHAAVTLAEADGKYYVLDVKRAQCDVPTFARQLRALAATHPGARMLWYGSSTELGTADLLRTESGLRTLVGELAKVEKLVRAQPVAAAWNGAPATGDQPARPGRVFVPRSAPWLEAFVVEVCGFTGKECNHDDQVDALAAAFDVLERGRGVAKVRSTETQFGAGVPQTNGKGGFRWG